MMFSTLIDPGASGVGVAFTDRLGGVSEGCCARLNLGRTDVDDVDHVLANLDLVRAATGIDTVVALDQVHGTEVLRVDERVLSGWGPTSWVGDAVPGQPALPVADAAVTALPEVALLIRVADCVPVLLADPDAGVVGAAHAGRVGFLGGVLPAVVAAMRDLGAARIQAWIGPHICGECYEVPAAMAAEVARTHPEAVGTTTWGTPALDLGTGCQRQLAALGVRVSRHDPCTMTTPNLFSHRRDAQNSGRQAGIIWSRRRR